MCWHRREGAGLQPALELGTTISEAIITDHALQRLRKRVGIPKRAALRHVQKVLERGVWLDEHTNARFRRWVKEMQAYYPDCTYVEYGGFVYVFSGSQESLRLITVLYPPHGGAWEN